MEATPNKRSTKKFPINPYAIFLSIVALVAIAGGSFYGGIAYERNHQPASNASAANTVATNGQGGYGGSFGSRSGRVVGQVTAISSSSITVQNSRTGISTTLSITSATQITDNGQTTSTSDIQTGDTVFVTKDTSNTNAAARIMVNPGFGGAATSPTSVVTPPPTVSSD